MELEQLTGCLHVILERAKRAGVVAVETGDSDMYWTILTDDWLKFTSDPKPAVGSLDDDLAELASLLSDPDRVSFNDFDRLAAAIRLLGVLTAAAQPRLQTPVPE